MTKRGKRSGYKFWVRRSVKDYELFLTKTGKSIGQAKIIAKGDKWVGEISTDIKGVFSKPTRSRPYRYFNEALSWVNKQRRAVSKQLFG